MSNELRDILVSGDISKSTLRGAIAKDEMLTREEIQAINGLIISDTTPTTPVSGSRWFDTITLTEYIWYIDTNSSQWIEVMGSHGVGRASTSAVSTVPPTNPISGQLWIDDNTMQLHFWYVTPTGSQWVSVR